MPFTALQIYLAVIYTITQKIIVMEISGWVSTLCYGSDNNSVYVRVAHMQIIQTSMMNFH
jgi:hypothetical protein